MPIQTRASARTSRASGQATRPVTAPFAVLIDGSALFLTVRSTHEGRQLEYRGLVEVLADEIDGLIPSWTPSANLWVMWSSVAAQNQGQARFLDFAEKELRWETRRFAPADSYMVDPSSMLGFGGESRSANRLLRFDAPIAFAMGRLAATHSLVVISDSYGLSDPFIRAASIPGTGHHHTLAFFGRSLDPRWQRVLRTEPKKPAFIDLEEHEDSLFGEAAVAPSRETQSQSQIIF